MYNVECSVGGYLVLAKAIVTFPGSPRLQDYYELVQVGVKTECKMYGCRSI
jgi:hypothetical protein